MLLVSLMLLLKSLKDKHIDKTWQTFKYKATVYVGSRHQSSSVYFQGSKNISVNTGLFVWEHLTVWLNVPCASCQACGPVRSSNLIIHMSDKHRGAEERTDVPLDTWKQRRRSAWQTNRRNTLQITYAKCHTRKQNDNRIISTGVQKYTESSCVWNRYLFTT